MSVCTCVCQSVLVDKIYVQYVCVGSKRETVWEKGGEGVHVCLAHVNGLNGYPSDCTCMLSLRLDLHMFLVSSEASCMYM